MDIAGRIQQLEELIREAKSMPLSASVLVNRDELLELVDGMKKTMPEEIKQARWVVKDREELLAKARRDAEIIVEEARKERRRMLSEQEVVADATREAEEVLAQAREQARHVRLEAEDYVDAKLAAFEASLQKTQDRMTKTIELVERGRQRLRGVEETEAEEPEPEEVDA